MQNDISADIDAVTQISAVPIILETVANLTGLGFVCIARVTEDSWTTCAVLDKLNFGLKPGDGLDIKTTICDEVRMAQKAVVIDNVDESEQYFNHHTPAMYGFQSYFSIPIYRKTGQYFGSLCGLDPAPNNLSAPSILSTLTLFAQVISLQLETQDNLETAKLALKAERDNAELREQFIAVLGHDLRNPLASIVSGADLLSVQNTEPKFTSIIERIRRSARRISSLTDDVMDFARGRMGGINVDIAPKAALTSALEHVVAELQSTLTKQIVVEIEPNLEADCDAKRIAQMVSNLLKNAIDHGAQDKPVSLRANVQDGKLCISVTNHGPKIPPEKCETLFKPFWRDGYHQASQGLGLGLFIVSEITSAHQGRISVESTDEETTFNFVLPVNRAPLIHNYSHKST